MLKRILPLLFMLAAVTFAQSGRGGGMGRLSWDSELNLTTQQLSQITKLRNQYQTARIGDQADVKRLRLELRQLMQAEQPDQKAIDKTVASISDHREALEKQWVNHRLEVRKLLTPEQRVLFDARPAGQGRGMGRGFGLGTGDHDGTGMRGYGRRGGGNRW